MQVRFRPRAVVFALMPLWLSLLGCEEKKAAEPTVSLKGKIVDNGKPWAFDEAKVKYPKGVSAPPGVRGAGGGSIQLAFISMEGKDVSYAQLDTEAGTFQLLAIKPGKYKIALYSTSPGAGGSDPFGNKFTQDKTQIVRDIVGGEELVIDISKVKG